jgi:hypothetical protein
VLKGLQFDHLKKASLKNLTPPGIQENFETSATQDPIETKEAGMKNLKMIGASMRLTM